MPINSCLHGFRQLCIDSPLRTQASRTRHVRYYFSLPLLALTRFRIRAAYLPPEMLDRIFSQIPAHDHVTLKAVSLASRCLSDCVHRYLWEEAGFFVDSTPIEPSDDPEVIAVREEWAQTVGEEDDAAKCKTFEEIRAFLREHPDIARLIKSLKLRFHTSKSRVDVALCKIDLPGLLRTLNSLPNLQRLFVVDCVPLEAISPAVWSDESVSTANLRELHYTFDTKTPDEAVRPAILRLLGLFSGIDVLQIHKKCAITKDLVISAAPQSAADTPRFLQLKALCLCSCLSGRDAHLAGLLPQLSPGGSLSSITVGFTNIHPSIQSFLNTRGLASLSVTALNGWNMQSMCLCASPCASG